VAACPPGGACSPAARLPCARPHAHSPVAGPAA
jgi:hypothetical protein